MSLKPPICIDDCLICSVRGEEHLFCNFSVHAGKRLNDIKSATVYPKGAVLFIEGQQPIGVFVLCAGTVKLSTSSGEGKRIITKLSKPGDLLGLNAVVSNRPYEVSAEMMEPGQVSFIARASLFKLLDDHGEVVLREIEQLNCNYYTAHEVIRTLGLAVSDRVSKFLPSHHNASSQIMLTQEEIAESIGTTRNTVTRLLSEFRKRQLIPVKSTTQHRQSA